MGLELRPAVEAIGSGERELRIMQREILRISAPVVCVHLRDGIGITGAERLQQFLRLPCESVEIRCSRSLRVGRFFFTMSFFPGRAYRVSRCARCPLARAEKSSSKARCRDRRFQGDAVLSADTAAP